jgi:hypothetical protein
MAAYLTIYRYHRHSSDLPKAPKGFGSMVTVFRLGGVLYLIYTRDHRPPYVHVKPSTVNPEWELRIYLGQRQDGSRDNYGKSFGDTEVLTGKIRASKIQEYVELLADHIEQAWEVWISIYGDDT